MSNNAKDIDKGDFQSCFYFDIEKEMVVRFDTF